MQSSNIGVAKIAQALGPAIVYEYIKKFGFGDKTGVDLYGEINGSIKEPRNWSKTSISIIPMGQEVGVTALQLCRAISVIANGGYLVRPHLALRIEDKNKQLIKEFVQEKPKVVISEKTAARMREILKGVIEEGTGVLAKMKDLSAGGKTGTSQKLEPNGTYSHSKFIASFIGFAPFDNPKIAVVVMVDEPRPYYFGGVVAAPVFKGVASFAIKYLESKSLDNVILDNETE
jgi:cell division protein FtsI (penicillin-binding protein 3)